VNDPGFATQNDDLFTGNAMTYYGRWTYKWEEASRQGAKAAFIIHETAPAAYPWSVVLAGNTGSMYALVDNEKNQSRLPDLGWLQTRAANQIYYKVGSSYIKEKESALSSSFKARSLNLNANLNLNNKLEQSESNNVVALLEGNKYPNEYIVISAHWDHFGKQITEDGVKILNGAIDNATGVAGTIELARMLMAQHAIKPFERSIVFANFTAEETGLLGSAMFALGGSVPMKQVVSVLNIDGMNALGSVDYILQYGQNMSEMEGYLAKFSAKQDRRVKLDPRPQNGLFFRSDHFSFAKQGVPGLLFMSLGDTDPDYIPFKYHKEADDYSANWPLGGVKQDLELIQSIAIELANNRDWPKWTSESDFKKRRAEDGK
jgi:Zn-dependent M28 family amino/carboxypeptidase